MPTKWFFFFPSMGLCFPFWTKLLYVISGFCCDVDEICALLGLLKIRLIGCPEMLVRNYHSSLRNIPEEHRFQSF